MRGRTETTGSLYAEYRREVEGEPLARALNRAIFVLFTINTVFILVDWLVYPTKFWAFLPVRAALDVVLAFIYFYGNRRFPVASSFATSFAGGAMLFAVVFGTGGPSSDYYVGLVLLFIGIGVLAPLSVRQGAIAIVTLFAVYAVIPLFTPTATPIQSSALSLFFLAAAAFMGIMSCAYLDRMRFGDFRQRRELVVASEELKELDREKSRFTANVHHELRTPLTLMLAPIDAFLGGDFGEVSQKQRRYLESMRSNGQRLLKLINNLLDLAKIESRQAKLRRDYLDIGGVVTEIASGARPFAERKGIDLRLGGLEELPGIYADRDAIEKIIVNLVGNALKFSHEGGAIAVSGRPVGEEEIELCVADTGEGLAEDQIDRIFDRFAQADSSNTRRHEGTGIGLALAKELVEAHGGRIWATSAGLGLGTEMHVALPVGRPHQTERDRMSAAMIENGSGDGTSSSATVQLSRESSVGDLRFVDFERTAERAEFDGSDGISDEEANEERANRPTILVVEDNGDMRRLLRDLLARDYNVRLAKNGREGLRLVADRPPDLVLTDVMMPEMSGTELCQALKSDVETKAIPVVLVTSKSERAMKIEGLEMGADDYVTKPFHPRELLARVGSLVRLYQLQGTLRRQNVLLESTNAELCSTVEELKSASSRLVQAERLAAVGELAAGVAHEVNNPVNFATNALRTMARNVSDIREVVERVVATADSGPEEGLVGSEQVAAIVEKSSFRESAESLDELIHIAIEGLERTGRLVGDLRDFAAPSRASASLVNVARGLKSTIQLLNYAFRESDIQPVMEFEEDLPMVRGNGAALNQVFLNLLKNAIEATTGVGGEIRVCVAVQNGMIRVEIRDEGKGIGETEKDRLFEPFFTTKPAGQGTGLGLSISKRIVMEHGGTIEVESKSGVGTSFVVLLPVSPESWEDIDAPAA